MRTVEKAAFSNQSLRRTERRRRAPARRWRCAAFEALEARCLLATIDFDPPAPGNYNGSDPANWVNPLTNQTGLPGADDVAVISQVGITVSFGSSFGVSSLQAAGDTIDVSAPLAISNGGGNSLFGGLVVEPLGSVQVTGGTLVADGGTISGAVTASSGATLSFQGDTTTIESGASLTGAGTFDVAGGTLTTAAATNVPNLSMEGGTINGTDTLTVTGGFNWTGGFLDGAGTTTIAPGGTLTVSGSNGVSLTNGHVLDNQGTTIWSAGPINGDNSATVSTFDNEAGGQLTVSANATFSANLNNAGTLTVEDGTGTTMLLSPLFNNTGTIDVDSGTLQNVYNGTDSGPIDVAPGATMLFGGNIDTNGPYTIAPGAVFEGDGTFTLAGAYNFTDLDFETNITVANFSQSNGEITGPDNLTVTNTFNWTGGDIDSAATTTIAPGATLTVSGSNGVSLMDGHALVNQGTTIWSGGQITGDSTTTGSTFDNEAGGQLTVSANASISANLDNAGTLTVEDGTGTTTLLSPLFNNTGTIDVNSGTLETFYNGTDSGPIDVAPGATMLFGGNIDTNGPYTIAPGAVFEGDGTFGLGGSYTFTELDLEINITVANFKQSAGNTTGPGILTITNSDNWTYGDISSVVDLASTATMTMDSTVDGFGPELHGVLNNDGTINWSSGAIYFETAVLNNYGTFDIGDVATTEFNGGQVNNAGTVAKTAGTGTTVFNVDLNNMGTVAVDTGTLDITNTGNATIAQVSGTTLTGGTWSALNGSTLLFPSSDDITTNQANVTLSGAGASFGALAGLASNTGALALVDGADFTATGGLSNSGTITLGPSSTLAVVGAYAQGATGALDVQLGGSPSSGQFGSLTATGGATLDGTLGLALAGGFVPATGDAYQVVTFPSESGSFTLLNRTSPGAGQLLTAVVNAINVTVTQAVVGADLAVTTVSAPASGIVGQNVTINYDVQNVDSDVSNVANWQDSVYLSSSPTLTSSAVLIGQVAHTGAVAAGGSYTGTLTAALPGVSAGTYHVIVVADSQGADGDPDRANNILASSSTISVDDAALTPGTPATGTITSSQPAYYKLVLAAGSAVTLTLNTASAGIGALFVRYQAEPSQSQYDEYAFNAASTTQTITIPGTEAGTYYILVNGADAAGAGASFSLSATVESFGVSNIAPASGSNRGTVTVTVGGSQFTPGTTVALVPADGGAPAATGQVLFQDDSTLYATFNLAGLTPGAYNVVATNGASQATDPSAFTVNTAAPGNLALSWDLPSGIRLNRPTTVTVDYANTGATDIPAPLLEFSADTAISRLASQQFYTANSMPGAASSTLSTFVPVPQQPITGAPQTNALGSDVLFLGISGSGPAGVLPPGAGGSVTFVLDANVNTTQTSGDTLHVAAGAMNPSQAIDWSTIESESRPSYIGATAWGSIFANLISADGSTAGTFQAALDDDATALSLLGDRTDDVDQLLALEMLDADAALPVTSLGAQTDASVPTPGLSLAFTRDFVPTIDGRDALGPFGQGWTDNWDVTAITSPNGSVTIDDAGDAQSYALEPNGSFEDQVGGFGTLTSLSGGALQLEEPDGTLEVFNANGTLNDEQDANGNRITAGYNAAGQMTSLTASSGQSLTIAYTPAGLIASVTDSFGRETTYRYDASNQYLLSVATPQGTTRYTYDEGSGAPADNALTSIGFADGTHQSFTYNAEGQLTSTSLDGGADEETFSYDAPGEVTVTDALGNATKAYFNEDGEIGMLVDSLGNVETFQYDPSTLLLSQETDALGQTAQFTYDSQGNVLTETNPLGETTDFTYGADSRLTSMTDADGNTTNYTYDASGNLLTTTLPDNTSSTSTFNPLGEALSYVDADGTVTNYTYNANGQITSESFSDGASYSYAYDAHGNLTGATDATGTTTFTYNSADELTKVSYPDGDFLQFTLDASGRRTEMVDQSGFTVNYQYAPDGQLAGLTDAGGKPIVTYTYNIAGELTRTDNGNGTYTVYTYDADGDVLSVVNDAPDGSVNSSFTYTYNAVGLVNTMTTVDGEWTYTYDPTGQLTNAVFDPTNPAVSSQDQTYTYNAAGDRTSTVINGVTTVYTSNAVNEYTSVGGVAYTYDANGNLTSDGTNTYSYNALNELTSVTTSTGTTDYTYDALGQLVSSTAKGQTTQYLDDPTQVNSTVAAYDGSGDLIADYTYGLGLVSQVTPVGTSYYEFDALGSTADTTNASGTVVNSYAYNPFGSILASSGTAANPFTFVGRLGVQTVAGGLIQMGFRANDPNTGQFVSNDPLGLRGGDTNIRRYVGNDPVNLADPLGLIAPYGQSGPDSVLSSADNLATQAYQAYDQALINGADEATLEQLQQQFESAAAENGAGLFSEPPPPENIFPPGSDPGNGFVDGPTVPGTPFNPEPLGGATAATAGAGATAVAAGAGADAAIVAGGVSFVAVPLGFLAGNAAGQWFGNTSWGQQINGAIIKALLHDPNDLVGPAGYGTQGFVPAGQTLDYTVQFENGATFNAPAQQVVVTEQLDPNLDWSTFQLGDFGFGNIVVQVPPGRTSYQTTVDATASVGVLVDVTADFDALTGLVTWTFTSLDPTTLEPPSDVFTGFLPPDVNPPEGDGFVSYSVQPKLGASTGTTINAQASVVFDTNAPIATPTVTNTIDAGPPTSTVAALAATVGASFPVSWSGSDDPGGSGIASYTLFVSDNGGPFTPWLTDTTETSATYKGAYGNSYAFYSVATDNVGNVQAAPTAAQATTQTVASPLQVVSISPSADFLTSLPDNQIVVTFNRALAGLVADKTDGTGFASNPFAVMLIPSGPDGLATEEQTGVYWSAPTGYDSGDLPIPATAVYSVNSNGTSTITLTPDQPLATDIYLITVNGLTDAYGDPLATDAAGAAGNVYASFDYRPSPVNLTAPTVANVTTDNGSVVIHNNQVPQPDTIGIAFSKPMDTYTINTNTVQLFQQGVSGALAAAVAYSPTTQSAYLTPETKLTPGAVYYVSVSTAVTDDQGFPEPGVPLAQSFVTSFTVSASGTGAGTSPLTVLKTDPLNDTEWTSALGYGAVTFSEAVALSSLSRFSAMLVPQSGSAVRGAGAYADVPVDAQVAFNPNTDQLIIVPTGMLRNDTIYLFELSGIKAASGDSLAGTTYSTFLWNSASSIPAVTTAGTATADVVVSTANTSVSTQSAPAPSPSRAIVKALVAQTVSTVRPVQDSLRSASPRGPLALIARPSRRQLRG